MSRAPPTSETQPLAVELARERLRKQAVADLLAPDAGRTQRQVQILPLAGAPFAFSASSCSKSGDAEGLFTVPDSIDEEEDDVGLLRGEERGAEGEESDEKALHRRRSCQEDYEERGGYSTC